MIFNIEMMNISLRRAEEIAKHFLGDTLISAVDIDGIISIKIKYEKETAHRIVDFIDKIKTTTAIAYDTPECLLSVEVLLNRKAEDFISENTQIFRKLAQLNTPRWSNIDRKIGVFRSTLASRTVIALIQITRTLCEEFDKETTPTTFEEFYAKTTGEAKKYISRKIYNN